MPLSLHRRSEVRASLRAGMHGRAGTEEARAACAMNIFATAATATRPRRRESAARWGASTRATRSSGFDIGIKGRIEPRVLPTNIVCIYAPRFAEVRVSNGPNQNVDVQQVITRQASQQVFTADSIDRLEEAGAKPVARARARALAGIGASGAIERR